MDMGMSMFRDDNMKIARIFWYIIAAFVGATLVSRAFKELDARSRLKRCSPESSPPTASRPAGPFFAYWATFTAVLRETRHPTFYIKSRLFSWLSPPSLGRCIVLFTYWLVVFLMATEDAVKDDVYYWERIGYRNAWVTTTQLPLVYLLANKTNPLGLLLGVGHERINWFHRWVARTMLITATLHGFFFYAEWDRANFVKIQMETMPMVKYGFGAWGLMVWNVITTVAPLRNLAYEIFVAQHVMSSVAMLWCIYKHIPPNARYNLWWSIGVWAFDRFARAVVYTVRNTRFTAVKRTGCNGKRRFGHDASAVAVGDSTTIVTLKSVHFSWTPGQYVYLWIPSLGPFEAHPYTVAVAHRVPGVCTCNSVQLVIRKHSGFSKRLHAAAVKAQEQDPNGHASFVAYVAGPYGAPPRWDIYENLVLVSASTGASFTLPILEAVVESKRRKEPSCTRRVDFVLTARKGEEVDWYVHRLRQALSQSRDLVDFELNVHVAKTGSAAGKRPDSGSTTAHEKTLEAELALESHSDGSEKQKSPQLTPIASPVQRRRTGLIVDDIESGANCCQATNPIVMAPEADVVKEYDSRLDIAALIRTPVEAAHGETSVVVCGGRALTSRVRNSVASLSDERAVHKGTGAQGIHLYAEEYSF
ncbi:Ferric reductase transmembrane component 3 [Ceratocystis lukuohia]|uniref:ferric-chelate reductase (NADPH) n=1 Tax=Ceratocystis lukuohia TaxID=2019550 RepID=A0ABR4MBH8_9PEZI